MKGRISNNLFDHFDLPIIRAAKNREVEVDCVKDRVLWLKVDDELVKVEKTPNGIAYSCSCPWCGKKGIANKVFNCSRIIRAQWYLIQNNGRLSSIQIKPKEDKK